MDNNVLYGDPNTTIFGPFADVKQLRLDFSDLEARILKLEEDEQHKEVANRRRALCPEEFLQIRRRYFETFKRRYIIRERLWSPRFVCDSGHDDATCEANVYADALMFKADRRTDTAIFRNLYGIHPIDVLEYCKFNACA